MEEILIRNLRDGTRARLQARANRNNSSVETEAQEILNAALSGEQVTLVDILAMPESASIEFEPDRLGITST